MEPHLQLMNNQPIIIVATVGHVANGKSTLIDKLTGVQTQKYADEKKLGCTIKNGYANAKIYKCSKCPTPECYQSSPSEIMEYNCKHCGEESILQTHISFVDNPGHYDFMKTMMNGTSSIEYALLVESVSNYKENKDTDTLVNSPANFPAPQTKEHLNILSRTKVPVRIVCLNKFDLIDKKDSGKKITSLLTSYVKEITKKKRDVIPISASLGINIDIICKELCNLPVPERNIDADFKMIINRSFNVNKQNIKISEIKGGVIGGIISRGIIKIGDIIKILPGYYNQNGYMPIIGKVLSINSSTVSLNSAISGGLIGIQLDIDPSITADDKLVGNVMALNNNTNLRIYKKIAIEKYIPEQKTDFVVGDRVSLNINSNNIYAIVIKVDKTKIGFDLESPICAEIGDTVIINKDTPKFNGILGSGVIAVGKEFSQL